MPRIPVELNGRTYTFAIDTGADPTVITDEVAAECGIKAAPSAALTETSTSRKVEWRAAVARDLRLGEIVFNNHPIAVVRKADLDLGVIQLDGIIGWPVFEHLRVEIDYARGVTVLSEPDVQSANDPRNLFWLGYPMVELRGQDGAPLYFGLDTGARNTSLNENIFHKIELDAGKAAQRISIGAGGAEAVSSLRVKGFAMSLGGRLFSFEKISVKDGVKDLAVFEPDGRLGGDVAYGGSMIIDFANGRFDLTVPIRD